MAPSIFHQIAEVLHAELGADRADITPDASWIDDYTADSLDVIEVTMALEMEFGIAIDDDEVVAAKTVADLVALVDRKVQAKGTRA